MTTTTSTTISGVSLITRQGARAPEVFEIVLSAAGIDFRRTARPGARLTWDRVSEWEIEERAGDVVLTLQGADETTPLLIPGWSATDLAALMRQLTEQPAQSKGQAGAAPAPAKKAVQPKKASPAKKAAQPKKAVPTTKAVPAKKAAPAKKAVPAKKAAKKAVPATKANAPGTDAREGTRPGVVELLGTAQGAATGAAAAAAVAETESAPEAEQPARATPPHVGQLVPWKAVVAIVLLGVLATAVIIVLLQSAGIIDWSFLGPNV